MRFMIDVTVVGDGVNFAQNKIMLNSFGETSLRGNLDEGPIDRFALNASVYDNIATVGMHTWNDQGNHVDIFSFSGLSDGELRAEPVEMELDGRKLHLSVTVRYYILSD